MSKRRTGLRAAMIPWGGLYRVFSAIGNWNQAAIKLTSSTSSASGSTDLDALSTQGISNRCRSALEMLQSLRGTGLPPLPYIALSQPMLHYYPPIKIFWNSREFA